MIIDSHSAMNTWPTAGSAVGSEAKAPKKSRKGGDSWRQPLLCVEELVLMTCAVFSTCHPVVVSPTQLAGDSHVPVPADEGPAVRLRKPDSSDGGGFIITDGRALASKGQASIRV